MMTNRRTFLSSVTAGLSGLTALGAGSGKVSAAGAEATVSFAAGKDRRDLIRTVMEPFENEIKRGIKGKRILIKPNNVWHDNPLCATHVDAVRGAVDYLSTLTGMPIIVGESTASPKGTDFTFEQYGYLPLDREYSNLTLMDLNDRPYRTEWILGGDGAPNPIKIIDMFLDPDVYVISLARMKTHNCVLATLAFKNILLASPINFPEGHAEFVSNQQEKAKIHAAGIHGVNYNMFQLAKKMRPDFSVIDGVEGMEGNGPANGTPVEHGVALAGTDVVAVDRIGVELMGIDYSDIGYLQWCARAEIGVGDREMIRVNGPATAPHVISYRLHDNADWQRTWKDDLETG